MDAEDPDPDPGGAVHRSLFYGLWPRFTAEEETDELAPAEFSAHIEE